MLLKLFLLALVPFAAGTPMDFRYLNQPDSVRNTTIEENPFFASVQVKHKNKFIGWCPAVIISEYYVMTSALVTVRLMPNSTWIRIGSPFRNKGGSIVPVEKIIIHPDFSAFDKDISVIKTKTPMKLSDKVAPIKLPPKGRVVENKSIMTITDWAYTEEKVKISGHWSLVLIDKPAMDYKTCAALHEHFLVKVTENMICGDLFPDRHVNPDNTGCPAVQNGLAVGIYSFTLGNGIHEQMMYTNIAAPAVRDFITKHTGL